MGSHDDSGIKQLLKIPFVYHSVQLTFGLKKLWKVLVDEFIVPRKNMRILDIGSGTSGILEYLHKFGVEYHGYDLNEDYIESCKKKWGDKGKYSFFAKQVNEIEFKNSNEFDVVLAINLLHHLDDVEADKLINIASIVLKDSGKLITADPCLFDDLNPLEKFMISQDRGRNIRTFKQYVDLVQNHFSKVNTHVGKFANTLQRGLIMECIK